MLIEIRLNLEIIILFEFFISLHYLLWLISLIMVDATIIAVLLTVFALALGACFCMLRVSRGKTTDERAKGGTGLKGKGGTKNPEISSTENDRRREQAREIAARKAQGLPASPHDEEMERVEQELKEIEALQAQNQGTAQAQGTDTGNAGAAADTNAVKVEIIGASTNAAEDDG